MPPQEAMAYLMPIMIDEVMQAESQGQTAIFRFTNGQSNEEIVAYGAALGISAEQQEVFSALRQDFQESFDKFQSAAMSEMVRFNEMTPDEVTDLGNDFRKNVQTIITDAQTDFDEILSPEQKQRAQELELVMPSMFDNSPFFKTNEGIPITNLTSYEALGLSDEQKAEMKKIQEKHGKELADLMKEGAQTAIAANFSDDEAAKTKLAFLRTKGSVIQARIRARILSVLTKEQRAKLEKIREDLPKKLKKLVENAKAKKKDEKPGGEAWKPDENSWKPGDPLPESAIPPKTDRKPFPQTEKTMEQP